MAIAAQARDRRSWCEGSVENDGLPPSRSHCDSSIGGTHLSRRVVAIVKSTFSDSPGVTDRFSHRKGVACQPRESGEAVRFRSFHLLTSTVEWLS